MVESTWRVVTLAALRHQATRSLAGTVRSPVKRARRCLVGPACAVATIRAAIRTMNGTTGVAVVRARTVRRLWRPTCAV